MLASPRHQTFGGRAAAVMSPEKTGAAQLVGGGGRWATSVAVPESKLQLVDPSDFRVSSQLVDLSAILGLKEFYVLLQRLFWPRTS